MAEQFTIPTRGDIIAGKYLIQDELGRGSYGVVFRARQLGVERDVALKTLLPQAFLQAEIVERFQREAALVSRLQHPNIVTLYDFGESDGVLYMAMEFIRGRPLSQVINEEAPVEPDRAAHLVKQVLTALAVAHREGIVHRDLKPENIILSEFEGDSDFVKVLDFGIAKLTAAPESQDALKELTVQGYVLGTPHYMSPETISGDDVTHQADLYAAGILLYELLAGEHPFEAPNPSSVLIRHLSDPVPPLPDAELDASRFGYAIKRALEKEPSDRVPDAQAFIDILDGKHEPPPPQRASWIVPTAITVATLLAIALVSFVAIIIWGSFESPADVVEPTAAAAVVDAGSGGSAPTAPAEDDAPSAGTVKMAVDKGAVEVEAAVVMSGVAADEAGVADKAIKKPADKKPADAKKGVTTRLKLVSDPSIAQVTVNGRPAGSTPTTRSVSGDGPVKVSFQKIGFRSTTVKVTPKGGSQTVSVKLKPGRIRLVP
jgi:eukaryotic-like serine/threonine-protein kinase